MEKLDKFQGHIVLYCKGHYQQKGVSFIEGLQRIWAVRCGYNIEDVGGRDKEYIADDMRRIIKEVKPNRDEYIWHELHKELADNSKLSFYYELEPIEKIIHIYSKIIMQFEVKKKEDGKAYYKTLLQLPKSQKRLFGKIVKGKGEYKDYEKVKF